MFGFLNPGFGRPGFFLWVLLTFNFLIRLSSAGLPTCVIMLLMHYFFTSNASPGFLTL